MSGASRKRKAAKKKAKREHEKMRKQENLCANVKKKEELVEIPVVSMTLKSSATENLRGLRTLQRWVMKKSVMVVFLIEMIIQSIERMASFVSGIFLVNFKMQKELDSWGPNLRP